MSKSDTPPPATLVVLLLPELLAGRQDVVALHRTLKRSAQAFRLLVRVACPRQLSFAMQFALLADNTELLLAHDVPPPPRRFAFAHLPQGGKGDDLDEFAFALSDVVLSDVAPDSLGADPASLYEKKLLQRASELGKRVVKPNDPLPALPPSQSIALGLDPDAGGWRCLGRRWFGRLEQGIVELVSFDLFDYHNGGRSRSLSKLAGCVGWKWRPVGYFADQGCIDLAPDPNVVSSASPLRRCFEVLDRSALHGSYMHRDLIWLAHFLAFCAVLAAVVGVAYHEHAISPWVELGVLVAIAGIVFVVQHHGLHDRWIACRLAAEQLRIALMCLPLMVVPPALITQDQAPETAEPEGDTTDLTFRALSEVKRLIRDYGLPRKGCGDLRKSAVDWVKCIVDSQITYHQRNHRKLERAEHALQWISALFFVTVVVAVVSEILPRKESEIDWLPLLTAAGPAFVAALHGAATRLGMVHRIALSQLAERDLTPIQEKLAEIAGRPAMTEDAWVELRGLAFGAAKAMGLENTSWHGQVRLQRDSLPA